MERNSTFRRVQTYNPFLKREEHDKRSLLIYRILTILTWLLVLTINILNCFKGPWNQATIWRQNELRSTPFSLNPGITNIYWYVSHTLDVSKTDKTCIGLLSLSFKRATSGTSSRVIWTGPTLLQILVVTSSSTTSYIQRSSCCGSTICSGSLRSCWS